MSTFPIADEQALINDLQSGSKQAFEIIFHRYKGLLYVHANKLLKDQEVARDIVQDIFLNLWKDRFSISINKNLSAYLFRSVRNRVINYHLKEGKSNEFVNEFSTKLLYYQNDTDHLLRTNMLNELIEKELQALPDRMRTVFNLSRKEGLSHKEIAEQLQISEQGVRSHIKNSLRILRFRLGSSYILLFFYYL
ncbi:RNA polymerase sigma factor [Sphingobacterium paucimobilis]|uniref:HTH luxR-type domain-containing protein n=1 Tax=Sphingobacterium paucimobilis HER1398 TaxID=1346330 RepID=U2HTV1_9SPHI|nr:RNA polymerase sigma-70 factor [Sphingobacterium paucimobilis]ERJ58705.1 hypothetical protein M472_07985 [Sphingobacterium paucimobilis HER1398]